LRQRPPAETGEGEPNPEANQPPLFYVAAALVYWLLSPINRLADSPDSLLLFVRLFAVGLVVVAISWPLRKLAYSRSFRFALFGLLALLLPGASESLARAANDAGVFVWAAALMWSLEKPARGWEIAALVAIGPLIKLTALPIVAMAVTDLWISRRRNTSLVACVGALGIVPLQWLRGWHWGGTLELNRPTRPIFEPLSDTLVGFARSVYTFAKTTIWLGEWSVFRPPLLLLVAWGVVAIFWIASVRWKPRAARVVPHLFGIAIAVGGFVTFAIANRRYFGSWGGVGGWYVWGWFPWLVVAASDLLEIRVSRWRWLSALTLVCVVITNAVYYWIAVRLYG